MTRTDVATTELAQRQGYSVAEARPPFRRRAWKARLWIALALGIFVLVWNAAHSANPVAKQSLSIANATPDGSMAVAEVLRGQGVSVRETPYLARARIADPERTTLAVTFPNMLAVDQVTSILDYPGDVVFLGVGYALISTLGGGLEYADYTDSGIRYADCTDPDALAAVRIDTGGSGVRGGSGCFADASGAATYVVLEREGRRIVLIADPWLAMNEALANEGNAALIFRALGRHEDLVWYTGAIDDTTYLTYLGGGSGTPPTDFTISPNYVPRGTGDALFALGLAGLVAALWRGRRMGALVAEPLPLVVHASESTRGRGRLYRRARAVGRASAALRAAAAERMGRRLGVPRTGDAASLVAAINRATRREGVAVERLLYGPPPPSEAAMMDLAHQLDALEKEVHRP